MKRVLHAEQLEQVFKCGVAVTGELIRPRIVQSGLDMILVVAIHIKVLRDPFSLYDGHRLEHACSRLHSLSQGIRLFNWEFILSWFLFGDLIELSLVVLKVF